MKLAANGPTLGSTANPAAKASLLGIPEAEFTPRVRDAIANLMDEVDRLRGEADQLRRRMEELARTADQDVLLPIFNRRAFVREIARFIALAERYATPSSVLFLDLDDFKAVNDIYGHPAGDAALRHFTELVAGQIRETDVLARLGGDEFGIILSHVTHEQAVKKGASLTEALRKNPPMWNTRPVPLSFSYGAHELHAGATADTALEGADKAMYTQKRRGVTP